MGVQPDNGPPRPRSRLPGTNSCLMSDSAILRQSKARDSNFKLGRYSRGRLSRNARTTSAEERTGTTRSCSWNRAAIGKSLAIMSPQVASKHKKLPVLNDGNLLGSEFLAEKAYG